MVRGGCNLVGGSSGVWSAVVPARFSWHFFLYRAIRRTERHDSCHLLGYCFDLSGSDAAVHHLSHCAVGARLGRVGPSGGGFRFVAWGTKVCSYRHRRWECSRDSCCTCSRRRMPCRHGVHFFLSIGCTMMHNGLEVLTVPLSNCGVSGVPGSSPHADVAFSAKPNLKIWIFGDDCILIVAVVKRR